MVTKTFPTTTEMSIETQNIHGPLIANFLYTWEVANFWALSRYMASSPWKRFRRFYIIKSLVSFSKLSSMHNWNTQEKYLWSSMSLLIAHSVCRWYLTSISDVVYTPYQNMNLLNPAKIPNVFTDVLMSHNPSVLSWLFCLNHVVTGWMGLLSSKAVQLLKWQM